MTAIVPASVTSKKQLKAHLAEGKYLELKNPTPWGDEIYMLNNDGVNCKISVSGTRTILDPTYLIFCTNHPKRSWFAQLKLTKEGWRVS